MSVEDRVVNLEQAFVALNRMVKRADERVDTVGDSVRLLTEMIEHHNARLDRVDAEQSNADARIAALADAQIRTEEKLSRLEAVVERLAVETDSRIRSLIEAVDRLIDDKP